jgi:hypothetical protein
MMALNLAMFLNDPKTTWSRAERVGRDRGISRRVRVGGDGDRVVSLFEKRGWSYALVNGGTMRSRWW